MLRKKTRNGSTRFGTAKQEEDKSGEAAAFERKRFEYHYLTGNDIISLIQMAPALRSPSDVARAIRWFQEKTDSLRKLEPRMCRCNLEYK